jgi:hypothetical protein
MRLFVQRQFAIFIIVIAPTPFSLDVPLNKFMSTQTK